MTCFACGATLLKAGLTGWMAFYDIKCKTRTGGTAWRFVGGEKKKNSVQLNNHHLLKRILFYFLVMQFITLANGLA